MYYMVYIYRDFRGSQMGTSEMAEMTNEFMFCSCTAQPFIVLPSTTLKC